MLTSSIGFIARVSKESAVRKKREIIEAMRSLEYMPHRFPFFEDAIIPKNKYHKMYIKNRYLILYQIKDDTVYVEYILDCRKDYSWLIK